MLSDAIITGRVLESSTLHVHESITLCMSTIIITIISNYAKDINLVLCPTMTWCTNLEHSRKVCENIV